MRQIVRLIGNHLHFLKDDGTLLGHFMFVEHRVIQHVKNNLCAFLKVRADGLDIIAGRFFAGKGVDLSADAVDVLRNLPRTSLFGAFEHHMFDKMRYARILLRFITGAGFDPYAESRRLHIIYFFHDDANAAIQRSDINFTHFLFISPFLP